MEKLNTPEVLLTTCIRLTFGLVFRIALRAHSLLRGETFSKEAFKKMLDEKSSTVLLYGKYVSLSRHNDIDLIIHIESSSELQKNPFGIRTVLCEVLDLIAVIRDIQRERHMPIKIILQSFWLKRTLIRDYFNDFLEQEGISYTSRKSGNLTFWEYFESAALFSAEQFATIKKTGSETGFIIMAGCQCTFLKGLLKLGLPPEEITKRYNRHHGLV